MTPIKWRIRKRDNGVWTYSRAFVGSLSAGWTGGNAMSFVDAIRKVDRLIEADKRLAMAA